MPWIHSLYLIQAMVPLVYYGRRWGWIGIGAKTNTLHPFPVLNPTNGSIDSLGERGG